MAEVELLKCPSCGATVSGEGEVTCAYCGSKLNIKRTHDKPGRETEYEVTYSGSPPQLGFFRNLPAKPIKPETTDIPFDPELIFDDLPGGKPATGLKTEVEGITRVIEELQDAINSEDLEKYMSLFDKKDSKYYKTTRTKTRYLFKSGNNKHYIFSLYFLELTSKKARFILKSDKLDFSGAPPPVSTSQDYICELRKTGGNWLFVDGKQVGVPGVAPRASKGGLTIIFVIIGAFIVLTVCLPISLGLIPEIYRDLDPDKRDAIDEFFDPSDNEESIGETVVVEEDSLELYAEPTTLSESLEYVNPGMPVGIVAAREDYWLHVKLANGNEGWTHAKIQGDDINGLDGDAACPTYDLTGRQNMDWVGKTAMVGPERVDVYDRPSVGGDHVAYINTGERLDVLESGNDFWVKVRTERGEVGWARCSFVGSHVNGKPY